MKRSRFVSGSLRVDIAAEVKPLDGLDERVLLEEERAKGNKTSRRITKEKREKFFEEAEKDTAATYLSGDEVAKLESGALEPVLDKAVEENLAKDSDELARNFSIEKGVKSESGDARLTPARSVAEPSFDGVLGGRSVAGQKSVSSSA